LDIYKCPFFGSYGSFCKNIQIFILEHNGLKNKKW